jgi:hypothetical protein
MTVYIENPKKSEKKNPSGSNNLARSQETVYKVNIYDIYPNSMY